MRTVIILVLLNFSLLTKISAESGLERIVITRAQIETSNNFRFSDFIESQAGISFSTIDGFLYQFSINALDSYQHQNYALYINEHKFSPTILGLQNINSLPVNISNIDSVVIYPTALGLQGQFSNSGLIRIYTKPPQDKTYYLNNRVVMGNEAKDPGPYTFTRYHTPNVDKIGLDYGGSMGYSFNNQILIANLLMRQHIYTDWSIKNRFYHNNITSSWPRMIEYGGSINFKGNYFDTDYSLFLSQINADRLYYYFEPTTSVYPLDYRHNHIGLSLTKDINNTLSWHSKVNYESESIANSQVESNLSSPWILEHFYSNLGLNFQGLNLKAIGFSLDYTNLFQEHSRHERILPGFYLKFSFETNFLDHISVNELIQYYNEEIYDHYSICGSEQLTNDSQLKFNFSYSKDLPRLNAYWFWNKSGYILQNNNILEPDDNTKQYKKYTGDIIFQHNLAKDISYKLTFLARYFRNYCYKDQDVFLKQDFTFFTPRVEYKTANGLVKGIRTEIEWQQTAYMDCKLGLSIIDHQSDDQIFTDVWDQIPAKIIEYKATIRPSTNFFLALKLHYSSKSIWQEYTNLAGQKYFSTYRENFVYRSEINDIFSLDLKIKKYFLHRTMAVNLGIKNLSNHRIYYNPIGASFDLSMFLGLEYNL